MIEKIEDHELLKSFHQMMPYFKQFIENDLVFTMSNTERFLLVQDSPKLQMASKTGDAIPPGCAADVCLKQKKIVNVLVPEKVFGVPLKTVGIPVFENHRVVGTMVIGMSLEKKEHIIEMSKFLSDSLLQMNQNLSNMSGVIGEIFAKNNDIENFLKRTIDNYRETDDVLRFIENISKQTNMLGLNAAIESVRAGEYGKGFSVVSNEIRTLSKSSSESVGKINHILHNIQDSIHKIYDRFKDSNELLEQQSGALEKMNEMIDELNKTAAELNKFADKM